MRTVRQHSEHARLRRFLNQKLENNSEVAKLEARGPQNRVPPGNRQNGNGRGRGSGRFAGSGNRGGGGGRGGNNGNTGGTNTGNINFNNDNSENTLTAGTRPTVPVASTPTPTIRSGSTGSHSDLGNAGGSLNGDTRENHRDGRPGGDTSSVSSTAPGAGSALTSTTPSGQVRGGQGSTSTIGTSDALPSTVVTSAGGPSEPPMTVAQTGAAQKGVSGAVIAVIIVILLLLVGLFAILVLRRRWVARRHDRLRKWLNRKPNSRAYDEKIGFTDEKDINVEPPHVTAFDRRTSPLDFANIVPTAPPTAEVRRLRNGSDAHLVDPSTDRFSIGSLGSTGSHDSFVIHHPTQRESFKFPKPPSVNTTVSSIHSRFGSNSSNASNAASLGAVCSTPIGKLQPSSLSRPPLTHPSAKSNSDNIPNPFADSDGSESIHNPFLDNPFNKGTATVSLYSNFSQRETILRPFLPSLDDEMSVQAHDQVKILEIFDDGWALAEKLQASSSPSSAVAPAEQGLIPIACLRESGQDISSLLNTKRVQSFHVAKQMIE